MSADNGIYILHTLDNEYRVAYLAAIDNMYWNRILRKFGHQITNKGGFTHCTVHKTQEEALKMSALLYEDIVQREGDPMFVEYGIQILAHPDVDFNSLPTHDEYMKINDDDRIMHDM